MSEKSKYPIVILTGAGISKESGLSTFRDADGIWAQVNIEDVATPEAFERDPDQVHRFYNDRRDGILDPAIKPNAAHEALAKLEEKWPNDVLVVTQNIDNLHERAGSRNLIHMHGELLKARCSHCDAVLAWEAPIIVETLCPKCGQDNGMRPHVVWFGEEPFMLDVIGDALSRCGLFISIGTSGNVYPAAGFVATVKQFGHAESLEINMEPSEGHSLFDDALYGPATQTVPKLVEQLLRTVGE
ncbi:NAD-dependent deacylase [Curvivirga aplysinae]|uniref:NAD-dependent deacylase n=1 Tax=Curvivirga aplysinae TaxID=2529852 RepID=UPI0012BBCF40|nr:NAD-dependent deacylase [Curvivirga aplysinae]MTI09786.1 NAD-dependent deacylase [Curvivirga aplysinae]